MQSSNPVFARNDSFNGRGGNAYGTTTYPGGGASSGYGDPSTWSTGTPGQDTTSHDDQRMTIDSVVQKSAITLGVLILAAAATWIYLGDVSEDNIATFGGLAMGGALIGFVLAMVNSFKRIISPALVLAYAAAEGVFVGAFSKALEYQFGDGLVVGAVLGTLAAVAGTLAAYKFFDIQVTAKFRKFVIAAMFGFVALSLLDLVLSFFGSAVGFNGFGTLGLIMSVVGLAIGIFMLILDFDFVERGIAAGLPEVESWRAAFGLTVTIVWIYIEILRILAILRGD